MFVIEDSPVCLTLDNFSEKGTNENENYETWRVKRMIKRPFVKFQTQNTIM